VEEVSHLAGARKHQCAAFIRSENCLSVWTDEVETVIQSAEALEQRMIHYVWAGRHTETKMVDEMMYSAPAIGNTEQSFAGGGSDEKDAGIVEEDVGRAKGEWPQHDRRQITMLYTPLAFGLIYYSQLRLHLFRYSKFDQRVSFRPQPHHPSHRRS
jgi:hypothetical protein